MNYKEVPSSSIQPVKNITQELSSEEIDNYFSNIWTELDKDYTKKFKTGKLMSKNLAGKSTNVERVMRAILVMYFDAVKEKIFEIEMENEKNRCMNQVHELQTAFDNLLKIVEAMDLDVDRKSLLPSLNGYIIETTSRIKK